MTVEIVFPIEFMVPGTPVSQQAKRPESRMAWKERVRQASTAALPEGHFSSSGRIAVSLFYFPDTPMTGDVDNIVKPVLDALRRHVYVDDRQVERILVQKFEPGRLFPFTTGSQILASALESRRPLLHVRVSDDPTEGLA